LGTIDDLMKDAVHVGPGYFDTVHAKDEKPQRYVAGPIPEPYILSAEKQLGVVFPDDYRAFIAEHGAFLGNGLELYGLSLCQDGEMPFFSSVIQQTELLTMSPSTGVDRTYIAISSNGMGVDFLIDTNVREGLRIVACGAGIDFIEVANNLDEFCKNMLTDTYATLLNEAVR
jgi:hypothetical protein